MVIEAVSEDILLKHLQLQLYVLSLAFHALLPHSPQQV